MVCIIDNTIQVDLLQVGYRSHSDYSFSTFTVDCGISQILPLIKIDWNDSMIYFYFYPQVNKQSVYEQIAEMILTAIQKNTLNTINKTNAKQRLKKEQEDYILQVSVKIK